MNVYEKWAVTLLSIICLVIMYAFVFVNKVQNKRIGALEKQVTCFIEQIETCKIKKGKPAWND
jgi:hypothetical protein